jgi:tripartite-type tricarboxylate transporter receptor subunit TctC
VVENRPGAGSTLGGKAVATADPDGSTLMWGTLSVTAIAPALYKDPGYDPKAFTMVGLVAEFPHVVVIPTSLPAKTMAEFIAYAKAHPGEMNFGGSLGTPPQLMGSMFSKVAGLGMTYVPYKGGAPSLADLMTGRLHMQFDALTLLQPLVKDGKLRALAVTTPKRISMLPDVPTTAEQGMPGYEVASMFGVLVPAGTPKLIVDRLNAELAKILASPEAQEQLLQQGAYAVQTTPEQAVARLHQEIVMWAKVIKDANIKAD